MDRRKQEPDGASTYPADAHDLQSYRDAAQALSQLQVPVLFHASDARERLYVAAFDGTGNSLYKDPVKKRTNVATTHLQLERLGSHVIRSGYVEGPGTQSDWITRTHDLISGSTFEARSEQMYKKFIEQSKGWLIADPSAEIRVAAVGFSRGAEEEAYFARLVHERGIQNPEGAKYTKDRHGNITHVEYTKSPLVAPGKVVQAVGLFDPVATGEPSRHNRSLPPSVISGFQISAEDERRDQFKSNNILDPGFTEQGHFLNVTVGGAHSDIGGGYSLNGLARLSGNLMVDYLNALSDRPFLDKQPVAADPTRAVVHRSEEHLFLYTTHAFERNHGRVRIEAVDNPVLCQLGVKRECWNKEPFDPALDRQFEHHAVPIAPVAGGRRAPPTDIDVLIDRLANAAMRRDDPGMNGVAHDFTRSAAGQQWNAEIGRHAAQTTLLEPAAREQLALGVAVAADPVRVMRP
jgi:hypothetical protein